jgi:hypothetical protein
VGIILARMESNPEEFFGMGESNNNKWRWIFAESLREVMSEPEKAAIFEGMRKVRRLEITHKAIATVMPEEEEEVAEQANKLYGGRAIPNPQTTAVKSWLGGNK